MIKDIIFVYIVINWFSLNMVMIYCNKHTFFIDLFFILILSILILFKNCNNKKFNNWLNRALEYGRNI